MNATNRNLVLLLVGITGIVVTVARYVLGG